MTDSIAGTSDSMSRLNPNASAWPTTACAPRSMPNWAKVVLHERANARASVTSTPLSHGPPL